MDSNKKKELRLRRHSRARKKVHGTTEKPRLAVFKSARHFYAQIIDDEKAHTLCFASTLSPEFKGNLTKTGDSAAAVKVGEMLASKAKEKNITEVVFDHGGFGYKGKIKLFAEKAREAGLKF